MNLPLFPVWLIEVVGSALMIVLSFMCVSIARQLRGKDPDNVVWTYLLWVSYALAGFAISRSAGHFLKLLLQGTGYGTAWEVIRPYSGSINTVAFFVVASITLFFERIWNIYRQISKDRAELRKARDELLFLNRELENLIAARTLELRTSERKYRRIFEVSLDLMAVVSPEGRLLDINPAGMKMLGITSPDGAMSDYFRSKEGWESHISALRKDGFIPDSEVQLRKQNKTTFNAIMNAAAEKDSDGNVTSIQIMVKDISERKTMEQQLLLADKLASIGQLAAGIAHEINNPLGIILGYTQLLLRKDEEGSQIHADHKTIEKAARVCRTIISDLLSFARSAPTRKGTGHIHDAFKELLSVIQHQFELDGIQVTRDFDPDLPVMVMDEGKIKQVLMNLLMNAKQAIGKKGRIDISTRYDPERSRAIIAVRDSGCGIDGEYLPRIFDPFFTTKPTGEGTGLGLSVSYGIVKDHGGDILVESEPGRGTTFTVILPVTLGRTAKP